MSPEQPSKACTTAGYTRGDSLAHLRNIIASLQVRDPVQRRIMYSCSLITGMSVLLNNQILVRDENLLYMPFHLTGAFAASYLAIGLAIAVAGSIVAWPPLGILGRSTDRICGEDIADIVDRLACVFVPITVAIVATANLVIGAIIG